jgi:hypothetical protein
VWPTSVTRHQIGTGRLKPAVAALRQGRFGRVSGRGAYRAARLRIEISRRPRRGSTSRRCLRAARARPTPSAGPCASKADAYPDPRSVRSEAGRRCPSSARTPPWPRSTHPRRADASLALRPLWPQIRPRSADLDRVRWSSRAVREGAPLPACASTVYCVCIVSTSTKVHGEAALTVCARRCLRAMPGGLA